MEEDKGLWSVEENERMWTGDEEGWGEGDGGGAWKGRREGVRRGKGMEEDEV